MLEVIDRGSSGKIQAVKGRMNQGEPKINERDVPEEGGITYDE